MNANNNQNPVVQNKEGSYFGCFQIEGFIQDKYKNAIKAIIKFKIFFVLLAFIECFQFISLLLLYYLESQQNEFVLIIILQVSSFSIYFLQSCMYYKTSTNSLLGKPLIFAIVSLILSALSLDWLMLIRFCQLEQKELINKKLDKDVVIRRFTNFLVSKFVFKILFNFFKSVIMNLTLVTLDEKNYAFYVILGYLIKNTLISILIHLFYLNMFVFQKQQSLRQQMLTAFEVALEIVQAYFGMYLILHSIYYVYALMILIAFQQVTQYYCFQQQQVKFLFNPMNISSLALIYMGFKITFFSSLYNYDLFQYEMIIENRRNQFQFFISQSYFIAVSIITFIIFTEELPIYLIIMQIIFCAINLFFMISKFYFIRRIYKQNVAYDLNSLDQLDLLNLNAKCRIILNFTYRLKKNDFKKLTKLFSQEPSFFSINFFGQISIEYINGFCKINLIDLKAKELSKIFGHFLSKSNHISVQIQQLDQAQHFKLNQQIKIIDCLRQISLPDQNKISLKDCDLILALCNQPYYQDVLEILKQYNSQIAVIKLIVFYKQISQYQLVNPQLVAYDLNEI